MLTELTQEELGHVSGGGNFVITGPNGTVYIRDNGDGTSTSQVQRKDGTWTQPITVVISEA